MRENTKWNYASAFDLLIKSIEIWFHHLRAEWIFDYIVVIFYEGIFVDKRSLYNRISKYIHNKT